MKSKSSLMEEIPSFKLIESFIPIIHIKINDGMEELKGRPFHWCVEVKINGDTPGIVRMQKVPGAQMPKWDCLLTFIPPSGHTQDIKLNPEFTEHFPMFNFVGLIARSRAPSNIFTGIFLVYQHFLLT